MGWKRRMAQMLKWCTVSSVTLYTPHPPAPQCICSPNVVSVAANNQKRRIVTAGFLHRVPTLLFLCDSRDEEESMDGWINGWMERNHSTLTHLGHWWKPAGCLETGADMASGCHRNQGTWRVEQTPASLPLPRSERSQIDMSACPKGKAEREETFPTCFLHCFTRCVHRDCFQRRKTSGRFKCLKRHGCVIVCKRT